MRSRDALEAQEAARQMFQAGVAEESRRLRHMLERCVEALAHIRRPVADVTLGRFQDDDQLLADLRRELGHPIPPPE